MTDRVPDQGAEETTRAMGPCTECKTPHADCTGPDWCCAECLHLEAGWDGYEFTPQPAQPVDVAAVLDRDLYRELDAALGPFVWSQGDVNAVIAAVLPIVYAERRRVAEPFEKLAAELVNRQDTYGAGLALSAVLAEVAGRAGSGEVTPMTPENRMSPS